MPKNSAPGNRSLLNHQNGKGSADRSPGYRAFYDNIDFKRGETPDDGFKRVSPARIRKVYGAQTRERITGAEIDAIFACQGPREGAVPVVPPEGTCCGGDCHCGESD